MKRKYEPESLIIEKYRHNTEMYNFTELSLDLLLLILGYLNFFDCTPYVIKKIH